MGSDFNVDVLKEAPAAAPVENNQNSSATPAPAESPASASTAPASTDPAKPDAAAATPTPDPAKPDAQADPAKPADAAAPAPAKDKPLTADEIKKLALQELLAEAGATSLDELKERLKPKAEETDEQKNQRVQKYESDLDNYAVTHKLMTRDEIIALNNLLKADDMTVAYTEYTGQYKKTNPDATKDEIQEAFDLFYHINSENAVLKDAGQKMIKREADSLRNMLDAKRQDAKAVFDDESMRRSKVPSYKQAIQASVKEHVPEQMTLISDGDNNVVLKLTPEDSTEIEKLLVGEDTFESFLKNGNSQQLKAMLKDKIEGLLYLKHREKIQNAIYEAGKAQGAKSGSTTGATASFALSNNGAQAVTVTGDDKALSPGEREKVGSLFRR